MPRRSRRTTYSTAKQFQALEGALKDHVTLWLYRALLRDHANKAFVTKLFSSEWPEYSELRDYINIEPNKSYKINVKTFKEKIRKAIKSIELRLEKPSGIFFDNIANLSTRLGLTKAEKYILQFAVIRQNDLFLDDNQRYLGRFTSPYIVNTLSKILKLRTEQVKKAISSKSTLMKSGLITLGVGDGLFDTSGFNLIEGLQYLLFQKYENSNDILDAILIKSDPASNSLKEFSYLEPDVSIIKRYLANSVNRSEKGVNILLYGPPGTGKTELAKAMAKQLNFNLYDVRKDLFGKGTIKGTARLPLYKLTQQIVANNQRSIVLFDEIEDIFPVTSRFFGKSLESTNQKMNINRTLENNPVPAIWISNSIEQIDEAYIRRFDYVLKVPIPDRHARFQIVSKELSSHEITDVLANTLADSRSLAPSHIKRVDKVLNVLSVKSVNDKMPIIEHVLNNTFEALGFEKIKTSNQPIHEKYSIDYLNTNEDVERIIDLIRGNDNARFCLYGPPGTGKTAFAQHLSRETNRPLHFTRASQILGKYVGETERNIANMFEKGKKDNAIILLDEADSMMFSRQNEMKTWEVGQINEMLSQLEEFNGTFMATTNRFELLDSAMLRRFDLNIEFKFLTNEQKWTILKDISPTISKHFLTTTLKEYRTRLYAIQGLSVADFFRVKKQMERFETTKTIDRYLDRLEEVSQEKNISKSRSIGFAAWT